MLSKSHAVFTFVDGDFFLKDNGSKNGSFINNFRLSKSGQRSPEYKLFSQDIVRFGSEVRDKNDVVKEECIMARVRICLPGGEEFPERPLSDRLYRQIEDIQPQGKAKHFCFAPKDEFIKILDEKKKT